ncbi:MAG: hypothetical protein J6S47_01475 [Eubacteriaceae bacterium]|nr:hypothetical protein [Eubacteriaceae bacterium]
MSRKKVRIRLTQPKKLIGALLKLALVIAVVVVAVHFISGFGKDPVIKELKKLEGQDVSIISSEIVPYKGDVQYKETVLSAGDVITYKVVYKYQLKESKTIKNHPVEEGVSITVSDPAYAEETEEKNVLKVKTGITQETPLTVKVTYSRNKDMVKEYNYTIRPDMAPTESE